MRYEELADVPCSITRPLVIFGDRWTLLILKSCFSGIRRSTLSRGTLGIFAQQVAGSVDRLIDNGILVKQKAAVGAHEEYRLTPRATTSIRSCWPFVIGAMPTWRPKGLRVRYSHRECAGEAHVKLECDTCGSELTAARSPR
ncbi:winged helix-turn-helix transcriptional regulator [Nocardia abscessus]|uniref:winged helix-turn-helix transcriptional regulator n=1 Tax=Nocardia abscessus TaxID=120957 RepID=UPI001D13DF42|nr:transcriptional regulator [Nocardia abscessus]MCC3333503.1 transcriptional regulator [Nocardia abscessus]